jgi:AcrR family transcriptional regulator
MTAAGERTRQALHQAAVELFAAHGFSAVTLPELGRAAGIGAASVYRHTESKEALLNAVLRERRQALDRALWESFDTRLPPQATFFELWRRMFLYSTSFTADIVLLELRSPDIALERKTVELLKPSPFAPLAPLLRLGQRAAVIRTGRAEHLAELARSWMPETSPGARWRSERERRTPQGRCCQAVEDRTSGDDGSAFTGPESERSRRIPFARNAPQASFQLRCSAGCRPHFTSMGGSR